jgi:hypothetical protein
MAMEKDAAGGARADRDRERRTRSKAGARATTSSAIAGFEDSEKGAAATATTAGLIVIFHSGHGAGRTVVCVPESTSIIACNIMQ